jgi:hypothetical protein
MPLHYLIFEASDDGQGTGTWDAEASVRAAQWPAVQAEVRTVMDAAEALSPGPRGPLDDGGVWDADVQEVDEGGWFTVTLTLVGPCAWGEALLARLGADE